MSAAQLASVTLLLLFVAGCHGSSADSTDNAGAADEARVVVRVQPAEMRNLVPTVTALGRCEALPKKMALLTPAVEGQVHAILVEQGRPVTAGQPIVQFDPTLAKADLAEKQAARDSLDGALKLLQSLPRPTEQEAGKLAIEQAKIAVARAEALVARLRPLKSRVEVSEQQMFEAEQALKQAQVQQQTAQAQFDVLMLGPRPEAVAEAQAKINAADEAVKSSQARLDLHTISAPIDGVLDSLTCRPGETIAIGASIGVVVDNRQILAVAWLPVARGRLVRVGQTAHLHAAGSGSAAAERAEANQTIDGQVVFTGRVTDAQTGNVPVHILIENPQDELVVGQVIAVTIDLQQPAATLSVPLAAVHDEGEGESITVVRDGKAAVLHPQLGTIQDGWVTISGTDLKAGEPVVVLGAYNLPDGTDVKTEGVSAGE